MYRAKETFWAPDNRRIVKGDLVAPHDPVVEGREELFEAVVIPQALTPAQAAAAQQETEQTTGTPAAADPGDSVTQGVTSDSSDGDGTTAPAAPADGDSSAQPSTPAAKKTAAKKTAAPRTSAGGDAK
ncbi:hypothetical protein OG866_27095 [Streptomyces sp. NBC_00663]|uniref:hypothetical protein n=1 Tax=Streptomyces sp. NBC_00663 TaxID=2975801 RepID=UPI002E31F70C|nr:hypothetical protein [Streptomyces sp. NBC_00663]